MSSAVIEGKQVTKRFGSNLVLDSLNFAVTNGVTGLLGPNGAGKTTLMGLILGLGRRDSGVLSVLGHDPQTQGSTVRARLGYAPEHHQLPPDLPANDFVRHIAEIHGMPNAFSLGRASDALWFVGLGEERHRPLGTLSTGQRQRVKVAMAIAHDPQLVLLDEPTDGLDPTQRDAMLDLIRRLSSEFGMAVLLSSHLLEEVEQTCENVIIINDGKVSVSGAISELRGEGRGVTVVVDAGVDQLVAHLRSVGAVVQVDGPRLVVTAGGSGLDGRGLMLTVRDGVADLGIGIRRLNAQVQSLEDVFLESGT